MIPGGKAGPRYLREYSILRKGQVVTPDEREGILKAWLDEEIKTASYLRSASPSVGRTMHGRLHRSAAVLTGYQSRRSRPFASYPSVIRLMK
jgi:hypothetical protein